MGGFMASFRTEYEKITEELRNAILRGDFSPGERLPQRRLAEQFSATTITIREALRSLSNEGLVEIEPKWGATVVRLSIEKLEGQYIVREALEGMAARLACERMNEAQREELIRKADECDRNLPARDLPSRDLSTRNLPNLKMGLQQKAELHYSLHELIAFYSGCNELVEAIKRLNVFSLFLLNAYHESIFEDPPGWHRALVNTVAGADPRQAEEAMRKHIRRGCQVELEKIKIPYPALS